MSRRFLVRAPARIHMGIVDVRGDLGRIYGSLGVAVKEPATIIEAEKWEGLDVEGMHSRDAFNYAKALVESLQLGGGVKIRIIRAAPRHVGLGSGTQLALSIAMAINEIYDLGLSIEELAVRMGRGETSGVGTYAFKLGGFVLDGGKDLERPSELPPLLLRYEFPEEWTFVIGLPEVERGLSGEEERRALEKVREELLSVRERFCEASRILVMKLLPALKARDLEEFGKALSLLEIEVGKMFSVAQGGIFRHEVIERGLSILKEEGAVGGGQSSWGPAFYSIFGDPDEARRASRKLRAFLEGSVGGRVIVTEASNEGARGSWITD